MLRIAILASVCLTACEPFWCPPENTYAAGLCISSEIPISPTEVEVLVSALEEETRAYYPEVRDLAEMFDANHVYVEFVDSNLSIECDHYRRNVYTCDIHIHGINYGGDDIICKYNECLGYTALAHELLHSVEWYYLDGPDNDHLTPWMFEEYGKDDIDIWWETVEIRMWRRMQCELGSCTDVAVEWVCEELEEETS